MDPAAILSRVMDQPQVAKVMRVLDIYGHAAGGLLSNGLAFSADGSGRAHVATHGAGRADAIRRVSEWLSR